MKNKNEYIKKPRCIFNLKRIKVQVLEFSNL